MNAYKANARHVLYDAIANKPLPSALDSMSWRKAILDRIAFCLGYTADLNYKNQEAPHNYNYGDHSIFVATFHQLKRLKPPANIMPVTWEDLGSSGLSSADK